LTKWNCLIDMRVIHALRLRRWLRDVTSLAGGGMDIFEWNAMAMATRCGKNSVLNVSRSVFDGQNGASVGSKSSENEWEESFDEHFVKEWW
jgi:hypothetical protein